MFKHQLKLALVLALSFTPQAIASHFYNIDDCNEILSGDDVNRDNHLNVTTSPAQATLIHPQVAITAMHGHLHGAVVVNDPINFGEHTYTIVRKVEPADAAVGFNDFCLLFLDRPVLDAVCCPLAEPQNEVRDFFVHTLSHNKNLQIDGVVHKDANAQGVLTYGRAYCRVLNPNFAQATVSISIPRLNPGDVDLCVPIGGDSGSTCFVSTNDGRMAIAGVMSSIDGAGFAASYMSLFQYKALIEGIIAPILGEQVVLQTIGSDNWLLNPPCLSNRRAGIPLLHFSALTYMNTHPDLAQTFGSLSGRRLTAALQNHYLTNGQREGRVLLPLNFNAQLYVFLHEDLAAHVRDNQISDVEQFACQHYVNSGSREGRRIIPADFNPHVYLNLHPDLLAAARGLPNPNRWALKHYVKYGFNEGRAYRR